MVQIFRCLDSIISSYSFEKRESSDGLDRVQALLGFNGYRRCSGEVFLAWENYSVTPTPSSVPVTFSVKWEQGRGQLSNCTVSAYLDGKEIGDCDSVSGGQFSSHPDAQDWLYYEQFGFFHAESKTYSFASRTCLI